MIQTVEGGDRAKPDMAAVGCVGRITAYAETGDGRYLITLTGVCRFGWREELPVFTPYRQVRADFERFACDLEVEGPDIQFDRNRFLAVLRRYLDHKGLSLEWEAAKAAPAGALINSLAMGLPLDPAEKQALLEASTMDERRRALTALL
jgi:Lon protease-like protein